MGDRSPKDKQKQKKQHENHKKQEQQKKQEFWNKTHPQQQPGQPHNEYKKAG